MSEKKRSRRGSRPPSAPAMRLRRLLAVNIAALLEKQYPLARYGGKSRQQQAFAKDVGISWSSAQRLLLPENGPTLDLVADVAVAFHIKPHELLNPELLELLELPHPEGGERGAEFHRSAG